MSRDDALRRVVRVHGRVQGVGFRWATAREAERRGLVGTVRNLLDGTVEADVEGPSAAVTAMLAWLEQGPPSARVERTVVTAAEPRGAPQDQGRGQGFRIL
ncbi:acylphosphatase [Brachybacterium sp. DNPG3]